MHRGTNPVIEIEFDFDTNLFTCFYATFVQKLVNDEDITFEKNIDNCTREGKSIFIPLTQEETLQLKAGYPLELQCRYKLSDGTVDVVPLIVFKIKEIRKDGVI